MSLHEYITECDIEEVRRCLDAGADVNERDKHGNTPLHLVWGEVQCGVTRLLIAHH